MKQVTNRNGKTVTLLNPAEKGGKYALELKHRAHVTNDGCLKFDKKGQPKRMSDTQAAFRAGYLSARKDSVKAYKRNEKKISKKW